MVRIVHTWWSGHTGRGDCVSCVTQIAVSGSQRCFLKKCRGFSSVFSDGLLSQPEHALAAELFLRRRRNNVKPTTATTMMIVRISCVPIATDTSRSSAYLVDEQCPGITEARHINPCEERPSPAVGFSIHDCNRRNALQAKYIENQQSHHDG